MKNLFIAVLCLLCSGAIAQFTFDKIYFENDNFGFIDYVEHGDLDGDNDPDFVDLS